MFKKDYALAPPEAFNDLNSERLNDFKSIITNFALNTTSKPSGIHEPSSDLWPWFQPLFSAHGLGKIPGSKHKCLKILWAIIFCISLTIFFIQCVELVKDYRKWPVTMSMRVVNQQNSGMHFKILRSRSFRVYDLPSRDRTPILGERSACFRRLLEIFPTQSRKLTN